MNIIEKRAQEDSSTKDILKLMDPLKSIDIKERELVVNQLFSCLRPYYLNLNDLLMQDLQKGLSTFNEGDHSFVFRDHIVFVSKATSDEPIVPGVIPIGKKQYFEKGGFGKLYLLQWFVEDMVAGVLKLSQKKLKSKDKFGKKIPLTPEERERVLKTGTPAGLRAKVEIEKEIEMMQYIHTYAPDLTGLHTEIWSTITFGLQSGYITRKRTCNGFKFIREAQAPAESCLEFMEQVMRGLSTLHDDLEIVHRDIKLQNILVEENGQVIKLKYPSCDFRISDFGNAVRLRDLFSTPYPDISEVIGHATPRFISLRFMREIAGALESIKAYDPGSEEYDAHKSFIESRLKENDECALGIVLYTVWTRKGLNFISFKRNNYFALEPEDLSPNVPDLDAKLNQIRGEIFSSSHQISLDRLRNENAISNSIISLIQPGLLSEIRTV